MRSLGLLTRLPDGAMAEWVELQRVVRGLYVAPTAYTSGHVNYVCLVYEVTERKQNTGEWRTRIEDGKPLYEHERPETITAQRVARVVYADLVAACQNADTSARDLLIRSLVEAEQAVTQVRVDMVEGAPPTYGQLGHLALALGRLDMASRTMSNWLRAREGGA